MDSRLNMKEQSDPNLMPHKATLRTSWIEELNVKPSITKVAKGKMVEKLAVGIRTPTTTVEALSVCCIYSGTLESL